MPNVAVNYVSGFSNFWERNNLSKCHVSFSVVRLLQSSRQISPVASPRALHTKESPYYVPQNDKFDGYL